MLKIFCNFIYKIYSLINGVWPILLVLLLIALGVDEVLTLIEFKRKGQII